MKKDNEAIEKQLKEIKSTFNEKLEVIDNRVSEIRETLKEDIDENRAELEELESTVDEIEHGVEFQGGQLESQKTEMDEIKQKQKEFLAKIREMEDRELILKKDIENLKVKNLDVERHNRKYNLLFYGIPESANEDAKKKPDHF